MALRWMGRHPDEPLPAMHFPTLLRECDPPPDVAMFTLDLMAPKALTTELGTGPLPPFIDAEFARGAPDVEARDQTAGRDERHAADAFFRRALGVDP